MKPLLILVSLMWAAPVYAHPGHLAGLAGHDHWVAGAAIGIAVVIGLLGALKGANDKDDEAAEGEDPDAAEASA